MEAKKDKEAEDARNKAAAEYINARHKLPLKGLLRLISLLRCEICELAHNDDERLRFFAGFLHLLDDEDETASRNWMKRSGKRVLPILQRYLSGPRFQSKRYLLRNLSIEDLGELHMLASELANDTEHVATKETFAFFPDLTVLLKSGNRKSDRYIQKTEWMVERLLIDGSLSDNQLSKMYLEEFGACTATTTDDARKRGWKSSPGSTRKIAADARDLVQFRHGAFVARYSKKDEKGTRIGVNPGKNRPTKTRTAKRKKPAHK